MPEHESIKTLSMNKLMVRPSYMFTVWPRFKMNIIPITVLAAFNTMQETTKKSLLTGTINQQSNFMSILVMNFKGSSASPLPELADTNTLYLADTYAHSWYYLGLTTPEALSGRHSVIDAPWQPLNQLINKLFFSLIKSRQLKDCNT